MSTRGEPSARTTAITSNRWPALLGQLAVMLGTQVSRPAPACAARQGGRARRCASRAAQQSQQQPMRRRRQRQARMQAQRLAVCLVAPDRRLLWHHDGVRDTRRCPPDYTAPSLAAPFARAASLLPEPRWGILRVLLLRRSQAHLDDVLEPVPDARYETGAGCGGTDLLPNMPLCRGTWTHDRRVAGSGPDEFPVSALRHEGLAEGCPAQLREDLCKSRHNHAQSRATLPTQAPRFRHTAQKCRHPQPVHDRNGGTWLRRPVLLRFAANCDLTHMLR